MRRILQLAIIAVLPCISALAQRNPAPPVQQSAADPNAADPQIFIPPPASVQLPDSTKPNGDAAGSATATDDRIFYALPNFVTVENPDHIQPLTTKQKFVLQVRGTFDPVEFPFIGFLAGMSQAEDGDSGYGQGARGYAKRYGSDLLDSIDENFAVGAIFPTLFKEDPRYYQLGKGGFLRRLSYSATRVVVTRTDSGRRQFNFSEILGSAMAAGIGTTYRTEDERDLGDVAENWGTMVGWDTVSNLVREFWPDIRRELHRNS